MRHVNTIVLLPGLLALTIAAEADGRRMAEKGYPVDSGRMFE